MPSKYPSLPAESGTYPNNIRELALDMKLSPSDLCRVIGTAQMTMYDICNGKRLPSFITERKLEMLFGKPVSEMYHYPYKDLYLNDEFLKSTQERRVVEKTS